MHCHRNSQLNFALTLDTIQFQPQMLTANDNHKNNTKVSDMGIAA